MTPKQSTPRLLCIALCLALACCATVPRAIIPAPSVIATLDIAPVVDSGQATREAVREVANAGQASREAGRKVSDATRRLSDSITRIETLAFANVELTRAFNEAKSLTKELEGEVMELTAAHILAKEKEIIAITTIDRLDADTAFLAARIAAQDVQINYANATQATLRNQVESLAESADKRIIAESKLRWWRKAAIITWSVILMYLGIRFFGTAALVAGRLR